MAHPLVFPIPRAFPSRLAAKTGTHSRYRLKTYDQSLSVLRCALDAANLGITDKMEGFACLDRLVRAVEKRYNPEAHFQAVVAREHAISPDLNGRSVFDNKKDLRRKSDSDQLSLFPSARTAKPTTNVTPKS